MKLVVMVTALIGSMFTANVVVADVGKLDYTLIKGKDHSGLVVSVFGAPAKSAQQHMNVKKAVELSNRLRGMDKFNTAVFFENYYDGNSQVKLRRSQKTVYSIYENATDMTYGNAWLWGEFVFLDSTFTLAGDRKIPHRSDFYCQKELGCKISGLRLPQLFEKSFGSFKDQLLGIISDESANENLDKYYLSWDGPKSKINYIDKQYSQSEPGVKWTLSLIPINVALERHEGRWDNSSNEFGQLLSNALNNILKKNSDASERLADTGHLVFEYTIKEGAQVASQIFYRKQIENVFDSWESINIIGHVNVGDRGFLYFRPMLKSALKGKHNQDPINIYEYHKIADKLELYFGVRRDFPGILLSDLLMLRAIQKINPIKAQH